RRRVVGSASTRRVPTNNTRNDMRAAIFNGPRDIGIADRPDPVITAPTDAVVHVVLACVCGSDLWYYRGQSPHGQDGIGHEFIGVVEQVGPDVRALAED